MGDLLKFRLESEQGEKSDGGCLVVCRIQEVCVCVCGCCSGLVIDNVGRLLPTTALAEQVATLPHCLSYAFECRKFVAGRLTLCH